jgi:hypothetical protein
MSTPVAADQLVFSGKQNQQTLPKGRRAHTARLQTSTDTAIHIKRLSFRRIKVMMGLYQPLVSLSRGHFYFALTGI